MKAWLRTALLGLGLGAMPALGESDSFGLGSGRDGPLVVREPGRVLNRYAQVLGPTAPGDSVLLVAGTEGFSPGDLVMVLQVTGLVPEPVPGGHAPIGLSRDAVGQWEFARLSASGGGTLTLTAPLVGAYAAGVTQVIRVPEYTRLRIQDGAEIRAEPWNGRTGGVVAFLATGAVINDGSISATGAGFRGGRHEPELFPPSLCLGLPVEARPGARKGEGIAVTQYGPGATGREAVTHGGGGGLCPLAGGGGGGNGGPGGRGGGSSELVGETLGGEGGAKLVYSLATRLSFGGGGGGGQGEDELRPEGGAGGGAVFIRANQLSGRGLIVADGVPGGMAGRGGAGGGGAGGNVLLHFLTSAECGGIHARGGAGGQASAYPLNAGAPGGGGGGGGGQVLIQAALHGDCPLGVDAGLGGLTLLRPRGDSRDEAGPGQDSLFEHSGISHRLGETALAANVITSPTPDQYINTSVGPGVVVAGTADPQSEVTVLMNSRDAAQVTAGATGAWSVTLTQAPTAAFRDHTTYSLVAKSSKNQTPSSERKFTVDLKAPDATITSHPDAKTQSRSAKFDFTHDDVCSLLEYPSHCSSRGLFKDVTFRCVLDGVSSSNCDDGTITYYDLPDGEHTFEVQASDKVNTGALQRHSWTIDRTRPVVTLVGMPAARMGAGAAVFKFSADEVVKAFTCTHTAPGRSPTVTSCSSPKSYDALAEGIHKFQLVAEDVAGNVSNNLDAYTWVVDLTGPATVIDAKPPLLTNSKQARFEFTSESGATFECALDAKNYGPCASPKDYDLIANGRHTFYVRGSDDVGNKGPEREFSWEVDFIPPVTTFTDTPATLTSSNEARFVFSADKANVSYYCALTGRGNDGFELCGASGEKRYSNLLDGSYTFRVQAIDSLGNLEVVPVSHTWVVDTTPPKLVINKPADGGMSSTPYVTIEGESEAAIKVFLFFEGRAEPIQVLADSFNGSWQYKTDFPLAEKSHTLRVEVTDWAGRKTTQSIRFTVNTFRPETQIVSGPPAIYKSGVARFVFSAPNVPESRQDDVQFKCQFDGGPWSLCEQEQEYFKIKNGPHELQVSAWLEGNEDLTPAVYQWEVRIEPPSVPNILVPVHGGRVETGSPAISGTVIPNGSVLVFIKGVKSGIALADATGAWTFTPSPPLTPGEYVVEAEAEDELGNRSESRSPPVSFTFEPPSPIGGYGEGGGGLSCAAGGSLPGSMLLWVLMGFWAAGRRRC